MLSCHQPELYTHTTPVFIFLMLTRSSPNFDWGRTRSQINPYISVLLLLQQHILPFSSFIIDLENFPYRLPFRILLPWWLLYYKPCDDPIGTVHHVKFVCRCIGIFKSFFFAVPVKLGSIVKMETSHSFKFMFIVISVFSLWIITVIFQSFCGHISIKQPID